LFSSNIARPSSIVSTTPINVTTHERI
jgi:hypothetical protein